MSFALRRRMLLGISILAIMATGAVTAAAQPKTAPTVLAVTSVQAPFTSLEAANVHHNYVSSKAAFNGLGQIHGMALTQENRPFNSDLSAIPRLANDGINTVDLYVTEYQHGRHVDTIRDGRYTPTDAQVESAVAKAHKAGVAVEIMPVIDDVGVKAAVDSRAFISPNHPSKWFRSYRTMIDGWAGVAHKSGADLFTVGSEYRRTQKHVHDWKRVISSVRRIYSGPLTYMDTAGDDNLLGVHFWRQLNYISISPYFTLSDKAVPSIKAMTKRWRKRILPNLAIVAQEDHRPVLFNELGYQSIRKAADKPYETGSGRPSQKAQANAYQAAIDATTGVPWLRGLIFFTWGPPTVASTDKSYEPGGKQAECTMATSWGSLSAPTVFGEPEACELAAIGKLH